MRIGILCLSSTTEIPFGMNYDNGKGLITKEELLEVLPEMLFPLRHFDYVEEEEIDTVAKLFHTVGEITPSGEFGFHIGLRYDIFMPLWTDFVKKANEVSLEDFMSENWRELVYLESPHSPIIVWTMGGRPQIETLESFLRKGLDRCCTWYVTGCYSYHT